MMRDNSKAGNNTTIQDLLLQKILYNKDGTKVQDNIEINFLIGRPFWTNISNEIRLETPRKFFTPMAALYTAYVFQEGQVNYFELRPWLGGNFSYPTTQRLTLYNFTRIEMRNFFYVKEIPKSSYGRLRNKLGASYYLHKNESKNTAWSTDISYEWYFLQSPAEDEQYSNSRNLSLKLLRHFSNNNTLIFKIERNQFIRGTNNIVDAGNSFTLEYDFW